MNTWIFYLTDSLGTMSAVAGTGTDMGVAESNARTKWDHETNELDDYDQRTPIVSVVYSTITTELDDNLVPGLIL